MRISCLCFLGIYLLHAVFHSSTRRKRAFEISYVDKKRRSCSCMTQNYPMKVENTPERKQRYRQGRTPFLGKCCLRELSKNLVIISSCMAKGNLFFALRHPAARGKKQTYWDILFWTFGPFLLVWPRPAPARPLGCINSGKVCTHLPVAVR